MIVSMRAFIESAGTITELDLGDVTGFLKKS